MHYYNLLINQRNHRNFFEIKHRNEATFRPFARRAGIYYWRFSYGLINYPRIGNRRKKERESSMLLRRETVDWKKPANLTAIVWRFDL